MNSRPPNLFINFVVITALLNLTGCASVKLDKKPPTEPGSGTAHSAKDLRLSGEKGSTMATTGIVSGGAAATAPTSISSNPAEMQPGQIPTSVTGDWMVGFQYNNSTMNSNIHLEQQGQEFHGTGTDTTNGTAFSIDQGKIDGGHVTFLKKYKGSPPVEYQGKLEVVADQNYHGPYMSGDYSTAFNGKIITNIWEAEMNIPNQGAPAGTPQTNSNSNIPPSDPGPQETSSPSAPSDSGSSTGSLIDKTPDLSGKWNVGYEYNFKTIHSSMFLEQDGDRITGHGTDLNTKEKFVIEQGWYHFPKLTLIRKYVKSKGAKGAKNADLSFNRTMAFKAQVQMVRDKDYEGPYLSGKTQGGGAWEAQMIKY